MAALATDAKPPAAPPPPQTILNRLIAIDATFSLLIHELSLSIPRSLFKTLEISGDGRFFFPIPISLLPFSYSNNKYYFPFLLSFLLGLLLDLLVVGVIKFLIRRPRPVYNKGMTLVISVDHWSFPSGHSSRVFFVAFFVYLAAAVSVWVVVGGGYFDFAGDAGTAFPWRCHRGGWVGRGGGGLRSSILPILV